MSGPYLGGAASGASSGAPNAAPPNGPPAAALLDDAMPEGTAGPSLAAPDGVTAPVAGGIAVSADTGAASNPRPSAPYASRATSRSAASICPDAPTRSRTANSSR